MSDSAMPGDSAREAKAQAKAAKAYAKAQRPWYKKKRWVLSLGVIVLIVIVAGTSSSGTTSNGSTAGDRAAQSSAGHANQSGGADGTSGRVGQKLTNAGTTYEVTKVTTAKTIGDRELVGARADGTFVIADLALTNNKDETKTFTSSSAHLLTSDGDQYEPSDKTVLAFGDGSLLLKDIQPDLTAHGKLAFDLPPSKLSGSRLVVEDLFGDGRVTIDLGL